jgi:hypothetical protein
MTVRLLTAVASGVRDRLRWREGVSLREEA